MQITMFYTFAMLMTHFVYSEKTYLSKVFMKNLIFYTNLLFSLTCFVEKEIPILDTKIKLGTPIKSEICRKESVTEVMNNFNSLAPTK